MVYISQQLLNMLQLGSIYAVIALGYTMVYGVLSLINFAHGDLFMIGAFLCFIATAKLHLPFVVVLVVAAIGTAAIGMAVERLAYRPLRDAPKVSAIITALGVGVFIENFTLALSPYPRHVPEMLPNVSWNLGGLTVSSIQGVIVVLSVLLMVGLDFIVRKTRYGMAMRALAWDIKTLPLMGVSVNAIIALTFAIGAGFGGAAGTMYAMAFPVIDPYMGIMIGWKAFIAAVVGGIGSIRGAMLGGYILGAVETFAAVALPSTYRDFIAFTLLLILLIFRPNGILGVPKTLKV
ncbi:branched-chain amino acid ABC transporter permease [Candidatus Magnetominusculus xianensis]|uniref:ABC transporter permease n=1 Tax=Candidatus Magnetominusculus xianensis TaxID=1748249 RepID=A0ABR5SH97_9BACT|nr:branched-chain amino acid ABC transporter permease [Candidatus Magnetominusculus xianensis]KWT82506.1 ABC transporter permease [Candidatus Magnetominusculus xianensis]MBF0405414.1 branched-chain amino acid ABC transporter permease [Nitrospirota bacterium]